MIVVFLTFLQKKLTKEKMFVTVRSVPEGTELR